MKYAYLLAAEELRGNREQWQAYESTGNLVVLAGPGSGKTKTISIKFARLLHECVRAPRGLAALTYNNESAREISRRLAKLGIYESERIFVGTIHSFCLKNLIIPFAKLANLAITFPLQIADFARSQQFFEEAVLEKMPYERASDVRPRMDRYRRSHLDRQSSDWRNTDEETSELVETYERILHENGYIDFEDMVLIGLRLLKENTWIRQIISARFPVFIVDEYQDLGKPLHEIVLILIELGVRIIAVGDPDQSIYDFTGAHPELLRELASREDVETITLRLNYRNGKRIVSTSLKVLNEEREFESANSHEGTISISEVSGGIDDQANEICRNLLPLTLRNLEGRKLGDVAVLYNDYFDAAAITRAVKRESIKYTGGDKRIRYENTLLTRWLEDCAVWCSGGWYTAQPRITSLLGFWSTYNWGERRMEVRNKVGRELIGLLWRHRNPELPLKDWLDAFVEFGIRDLITNVRNLPGELESFQGLYDAACDGDRLGDFNIASFGGLRGASDHLNLMTLHAAKGLEFDTVIIMGLEQGRLPSFRARTEQALREQRRRFYVGLTRARFEVYLLYSGWYENGYGKIFRNGRSEYISEIESLISVDH